MTDSTRGPRLDSQVPASFEDLRRITPEQSRQFERETQVRTRQDLTALTADGDFMKQTKWVAIAGAAIGLVLVGAAYVRPFFETAGAVQTAAAVTADQAKAQVSAAQGAVSGVAAQAAWVKTTDEKAFNTAKSGFDCLSGKAACANGASTPFK